MYRFEGQVPRRTLNQGIWIFANVLPWWKQKQVVYPTLAVLAKKYLAIEATSAASERLFSKARRITTGDRNRLAPEVAGQLLYVSTTLDFYEDYNKKHRYNEILGIHYQAEVDDEEEEE